MLKMREILTASVKDIERRTEPNKHYVYCIEVTWNDGTKQMIGRRFTEFFDMHQTLLNTFPNEAGKHDSSKRTIPFLPGKVLFKRSDKTKQLTLSRIPHIDDYCRKLVILPKIGTSKIVTSFFEMNSTDMGISEKRGSLQRQGGNASTITGPIVVEKYVAVAQYTAQSKSQVSLQVGDPVDVVKKTDSGWWIVTNTSGMNGWVPAAYIWKEGGDGNEDLSSQIYDFEGSWYIATQSYSAKSDTELSFPSGAEILVYEKKLDGWWNGRYNGMNGEVPGSYLEKDTRTNVARNTMPEMPTSLAPKVPYAENNYDEEREDSYIAICDITNPMEGEIDFRTGDVVRVIDRSDEHWWLAHVGAREGWVNPQNIKKENTSPLSSVTSPLSAQSFSGSFSSVFSSTSVSTRASSLSYGENGNGFPRKQFPAPSPEMNRKGPGRPPQPDFNKSNGPNRPPSPVRSSRNKAVGDEWLNTYKSPFSSPEIGNLEKISYRGDKPAQDLSNLHISSKGKHTVEKEYGKDYFPDMTNLTAQLDQLTTNAHQRTTNHPIENELWFKDVNRQVAERALLSEAKEGYFIVRRSQASNCPFSMTLYHSNGIVNFHIRKRADNLFATGAYSDGEKTFSSVKEIVDFYGRYSLTVGADNVRLVGTPARVGGLTHF